METDRNWIIIRIDGKLAGISRDYGRLADISARIAKECRPSDRTALPYREITAHAVTFEEVLQMKQTAVWDDLMLFGTDFQKKVWKKLWDLSHPDIIVKSTEGKHNSHISQVQATGPHLLSYSDFAGLCDNRAGVRAVAHAVGLNPIPVLIPCHLIVPKEAIDRIGEIRKKAQDTIFKGDDLCLESILRDPAIDFGEYALGKEMKRMLIHLDMNK